MSLRWSCCSRHPASPRPLRPRGSASPAGPGVLREKQDGGGWKFQTCKNIKQGEFNSSKNKKRFELPSRNQRMEKIFKEDLFLRGVASDTALPSARQHPRRPAAPASKGNESANEGFVRASQGDILQGFVSKCHF